MPTKPKVEQVIEDVKEPLEKGQTVMYGLVRKAMLATIGAAAIAQEELEALINRLVERGEIAEQDGKKLVHELMDKRKSKTADFEEDINKNLEGVLQRMNIPTKGDVEELGNKITNLSKKVDELKKS
jgi:poly(hydroxyalkanoate) granule-associated protein